MLNLKTNGNSPQVSSAQSTQSHTVLTVSSTGSGGSKDSVKNMNKKHLFIATYNIQTMRTEDHLTELEEELKNIKWHIIGLCETRLPGEKMTILKSGNILYQNNSETDHHLGGVAFLINKNIKHLITNCQAISRRIISMTLKVNRRYTMQIIHTYAPTSASEDTEVEQMYEDIANARKSTKAKFVVCTGDFNAKIGQRLKEDPENVGNFGLGKRNTRGEMLLNFLTQENLYCLNTFFQKKNKEKMDLAKPRWRNKERNRLHNL